MSKSIYELIKDIQDYFKYRKPLHLSFGRKIVPTYIVNPMPEQQTLVDESCTPVQNTWVTLLNHVKNCRILSCNITQAVADETYEVYLAIDGVVYSTVGVNCTAGTAYTIAVKFGAYAIIVSGDRDEYSPFVVEGRDVTLKVRKTTAAGANAATLTCNYQVW